MAKSAELLTDGNAHEERARYAKAVAVADHVADLYGPDAMPTNAACRRVAAYLAELGEINARPLSDRTCELVRAVLSARGRAIHDLRRAGELVSR